MSTPRSDVHESGSAGLSVLYRGPLSSCNYDCGYCPFAKRHETASELAADRAALGRFVEWAVGYRRGTLAVFFTPWGEALVRRWYREAMVQLSRLDHVVRVAVQTNLSRPLDWLDDCRPDRVAFWCTYHPSQTSRAGFLGRVAELARRGIRHSVGMVGRPEDFDEIEAVRRELPTGTYLWINAWDTGDGRKYAYSPAELRRLEAVDPWFRLNTLDHPSLGRACRTGRSVVSVDGDGTIRRCHFVRTPIGNIYERGWEKCLKERPCPNATCGCHIGYAHLDELQLDRIFGDGLLERVPAGLSAKR